MGKLTIQEVARVLTEKNGLPAREANQFASEMFAVILQRLQQGEMVKVKGLGTFKITSVEARESISVRTGERVVISGHSKVSFTPDNTMRELVNKPFSQFETVLLNDGVVFEDLKDDVTEEELAAADADDVVEQEPETESGIESQPVPGRVAAVADIASAPVVEPVREEVPVVEPVREEVPVVEPVREEVPVVEPVREEVPVVEPVVEEEPSQEETLEVPTDEEEGENEGRPWGKWIGMALGVLVLMAVSAFGGYYYGITHWSQMEVFIPDTIVVTDTVYMADLAESQEDMELQDDVEEPTSEVAEPQADAEKPQPKPVETVQPQKQQTVAEVDDYASKDARVRLGAYRIVGLDREVKVQPGQTFYGICRANLGPDMECYVEVYNGLPSNPTIKVGQVIKIPKLEWKKRRK